MQRVGFWVVLFGVLLLSISGVQAQEANHCVVRVYPAEQNRKGELLGCFDTASEALAYATNNRIVVPDEATPEQISSAVRAFQASEVSTGARSESIATDNVVSIQWDWTDRGADSIYFTSTSTCPETLNGHLLSTDYSVYPGSSWDNRVASAEAFAGCSSVQLWDLANFQGSNITCSTYCANMGAMNDATSSSRTWK